MLTKAAVPVVLAVGATLGVVQTEPVWPEAYVDINAYWNASGAHFSHFNVGSDVLVRHATRFPVVEVLDVVLELRPSSVACWDSIHVSLACHVKDDCPASV